MSNHGHIQDQIIDYVYGELDAPGTAAVERHVSTCASCAEELAKLQGVRRAALALPQVQPRAEVTETILRRGRELAPAPARKPSLWSWFLRPAFGGAFLFLVTLGVGLYVARTGSHGGAPEELPSANRFVAPAGSTVAAAPPAAAPPAAAPSPVRGLRAADPAQLAKNDEKTRSKRMRDSAVAPSGAPSALVPGDGESPRIIAQVARPAEEKLFPETRGPAPAKPTEAAPKAESEPVRPADAPAALAQGAPVAAERGEGLAMGFGELGNKESAVDRNARLAEGFGQTGYGAGGGQRGGVTAREQEAAAVPKTPPPAQLAFTPPPAPPPPAAPAPAVPAAASPRFDADDAVRAETTTVARRRAPVSTAAPALAEPATGEAADTLLARAETEHARGDLAAAIATLERLFRENPGYTAPRAFELLASAYERRGDTARAAAVRARARAVRR